MSVLVAFNFVGSTCDFASFVHDKAVLTHASSFVVVNFAFLIVPALERGNFARAVAFSRGNVTGQIGRAVRISDARVGLHHRRRQCAHAFRIRLTDGIGHAHVTLGTGAPGSVQERAAEGVLPARAPQTARVYALEVDASFLAGTF